MAVGSAAGRSVLAADAASIRFWSSDQGLEGRPAQAIGKVGHSSMQLGHTSSVQHGSAPTVKHVKQQPAGLTGEYVFAAVFRKWPAAALVQEGPHAKAGLRLQVAFVQAAKEVPQPGPGRLHAG